MKSLRLLALGMLAIGMLALGVTSGEAETFHLRYGIASVSFTYGPFYVAQDLGFFKKEGVDLEEVQVPGSGPAAAATVAGSFQFFVGLPQTAALATEKGQPLSTFALVTKEYGSNIVVSKTWAEQQHLTHAMPIEQRLAHMRGMKIAGWTPGGSSDMFIRFIAAKEGWNAATDSTISTVGPSGPMLAALKNNRLDGFAFSAPTSYEAVDRMGAFILYNGASGEWAPLKGEPYMCLIGNTDWMTKNPAAAQAVYRGLAKAMAYMKTNPAAAKAVIRKRLSAFDDSAFEAGYKDAVLTFPDTPSVGGDQAEKIKDFVETVYHRPLAVPAAQLVNDAIGLHAMAAANR